MTLQKIQKLRAELKQLEQASQVVTNLKKLRERFETQEHILINFESYTTPEIKLETLASFIYDPSKKPDMLGEYITTQYTELHEALSSAAVQFRETVLGCLDNAILTAEAELENL